MKAISSGESDKILKRKVLTVNKKFSLFFIAFATLILASCSDSGNTITDDNSATSTAVETSEVKDNANESSLETEEPKENTEELFQQVRNNEPTSERIAALEEIAMHYYWYGGDMKKAEKELFQGITLHGDYDVVEQSFARATVIDPYDVELKRSLASAQILQDKIPEALKSFEEIIDIDPDNFEAHILHAAYSKVTGDTDSFEKDIQKLSEIDQERGQEYEVKFDSIEEIEKTTLNSEVPENITKDNHAIITLGYALSDEGEMQETLLERLKVTLKAAEKYPDSKIIVTGGVPKKGHTEAELMYDWLVEKGIDKERIFKEALATDTVENALFSMDIVREEGLQDITLITSASHMRRALVTFNEASQLMDTLENKTSNREFTNVVYMDYDSEEEAQKVTEEEEMVIYRDFIRTSGIWQFPGLQR